MKHMKKVMIILVVAISIIATNCAKEDDNAYFPYSAIGLLHITTDSTILVSDENERLLIKTSISSDFKDNDRVVIQFKETEETLPQGINSVIEVGEVIKVLTKPIFVLQSQFIDSIGDDELTINSLWVGKNYLNLNFTYYGGYQDHYINLTRQPGDIRTDTVELAIKHNNNEDSGNSGFYAFVSFDLTTLKNDVADSVILHITAKEFNSRTYNKFFTYKY
jgi:hypothetical protein